MPQAKAVAVGDLSSMEETRRVAEQVNALGRHDAVIHNAGVGYREARRIETVDGLSHVFAVNVLAPYLLTALITPPDRLVYLSSGMHVGGDPHLRDPQWAARRWNGALHKHIFSAALRLNKPVPFLGIEPLHSPA